MSYILIEADTEVLSNVMGRYVTFRGQIRDLCCCHGLIRYKASLNRKGIFSF